eukprot:g9897.t1
MMRMCWQHGYSIKSTSTTMGNAQGKYSEIYIFVGMSPDGAPRKRVVMWLMGESLFTKARQGSRHNLSSAWKMLKLDQLEDDHFVSKPLFDAFLNDLTDTEIRKLTRSTKQRRLATPTVTPRDGLDGKGEGGSQDGSKLSVSHRATTEAQTGAMADAEQVEIEQQTAVSPSRQSEPPPARNVVETVHARSNTWTQEQGSIPPTPAEMKRMRRRLSITNTEKSSMNTLDGVADPYAPPKILTTTEQVAKSAWTKFASISHVGYVPFNRGKVNQDRVIYDTGFAGSPSRAFFGVFDGHGDNGHWVSTYVSKVLPTAIEFAFNEHTKHSDKKYELAQLLSAGYLLTCRKLEHESGVDCLFSGTTACTIYMQGNEVHCSNVGDSRAVLGRRDEQGDLWAVPLSLDQKPDREDEYQRIMQRGGRVHPLQEEDGSFVGPQRLWLKDRPWPGLAMSRSFGDFIAVAAGITALPEVHKHELVPGDEFIILASDGVWELISNAEAVSIVDHAQGDPKLACELLYQESARRWKEQEEVIDDISALVIFVDPLALRGLPPETVDSPRVQSSSTHTIEALRARMSPTSGRSRTPSSSSQQQQEQEESPVSSSSPPSLTNAPTLRSELQTNNGVSHGPDGRPPSVDADVTETPATTIHPITFPSNTPAAATSKQRLSQQHPQQQTTHQTGKQQLRPHSSRLNKPSKIPHLAHHTTPPTKQDIHVAEEEEQEEEEEAETGYAPGEDEPLTGHQDNEGEGEEGEGEVESKHARGGRLQTGTTDEWEDSPDVMISETAFTVDEEWRSPEPARSPLAREHELQLPAPATLFQSEVVPIAKRPVASKTRVSRQDVPKKKKKGVKKSARGRLVAVPTRRPASKE